MRYFHKRKNSYFCPSINLDKLWGLIPEVIPPPTRFLWASPSVVLCVVSSCLQTARKKNMSPVAHGSSAGETVVHARQASRRSMHLDPVQLALTA